MSVIAIVISKLTWFVSLWMTSLPCLNTTNVLTHLLCQLEPHGRVDVHAFVVLWQVSDAWCKQCDLRDILLSIKDGQLYQKDHVRIIKIADSRILKCGTYIELFCRMFNEWRYCRTLNSHCDSYMTYAYMYVQDVNNKEICALATGKEGDFHLLYINTEFDAREKRVTTSIYSGVTLYCLQLSP